MPLFLNAIDYQDYLDALARTMSVFAIEVHGYTLMTNHLHLLLRPLREALSDGMERLLGWYSRRFNWRHGRHGHLFQDRFLSKVVGSIRYLKNLVAYFGNNPVKAGLCRHPEQYPHGSFGQYFERPKPFLQVDVVQALFPGGKDELRSFTAGQIGIESDSMGWALAPEWYEDVDAALTAPPAPIEPPSDLVVRMVAESRSIDPEVLKRAHKNRQIGPVKGLAALVLRDSTSLSLAEIAQATGFVSTEGVCRAISVARERANPEEVGRLLQAIRQMLTC